jgi:predicted RNase H-like HicB family nuclease
VSEYIVIFEQADDGGWGAYLPDLPGVVALGDSRAEVEERIKEALQAYADEMRSLGRELPEPAHTVGTIHA